MSSTPYLDKITQLNYLERISKSYTHRHCGNFSFRLSSADHRTKEVAKLLDTAMNNKEIPNDNFLSFSLDTLYGDGIRYCKGFINFNKDIHTSLIINNCTHYYGLRSDIVSMYNKYLEELFDNETFIHSLYQKCSVKYKQFYESQVILLKTLQIVPNKQDVLYLLSYNIAIDIAKFNIEYDKDIRDKCIQRDFFPYDTKLSDKNVKSLIKKGNTTELKKMYNKSSYKFKKEHLLLATKNDTNRIFMLKYLLKYVKADIDVLKSLIKNSYKLTQAETTLLKQFCDDL
jgi:hypothetical protein